MDDIFNKDLKDLQVQLQSELLRSLPPTMRDELDHLLFIVLYRNLQPPCEVGTREAKRILKKYRKLGWL
jgi:hypothetical protein